MASVAGCSSRSDSVKKPTLKKSEACHQCRKRKVKCDAQRPCSNCYRAHQKMIRINPHLCHIEPNCTYDRYSGITWEPENDVSVQSLDKLEQRVEELDGLLSGGGHSSSASPPNQSTTTYNSNLGMITGLSEQALFDSHESSPSIPIPSPFPLMVDEWPSTLPPRPLMLHLIDLFFTCYPNSLRVIHRPTFLVQLLEHPSSPRFPFVPLLHAICAAAAKHSHLVAVAPVPDLYNHPAEDAFQEKTRMQQGRGLMFDEQHYMLTKYGCMAAAREGRDLMGVIQACIITGWWAFACGRWLDLWASNGLAMRLCIASGLNMPDSLQKPLPARTRESLLMGAPLSHTDVELRRNVFWLSYCMERYHLAPDSWAFDISDEDIHQTIAGTLEAFEAGVDDGQERQNVSSIDLFTTHRSNVDDFGMYIKGAIMLSRVHTTQHRSFVQYETIEGIQNSHQLRNLEVVIASMRSSVLKMQLNPIEQCSTSVISNSYIAHMAPHWASIKLHISLANWSDPSCESANKALSAARSIIRYIAGLSSTSWDYSRLDRVASLCWAAAGRGLLLSLQHAPKSLAPILRAEIRLVRDSFMIAGDRVGLYLRQRRIFDLEIVDHLGEREAAKVFAEDEF